MTMWTGAGAFSSRDLCFIDFENLTIGAPAFGLDQNDNIIPQNYGTATLIPTSKNYAAYGTDPIYIREIGAGSGNKAIEITEINQAIRLNLNETVDLTDADEDEFVFEFKFVAAGNHARMRTEFLDQNLQEVFTLTAGAQAYQIPFTNGGGFEMNLFSRNSSTYDTVKVVFKRDTNSVLVYVNGVLATARTDYTNPETGDLHIKQGEQLKAHRTEGLGEISTIRISKTSSTNQNPFYIDDIYVYEQMDTSIPNAVVDFEDDYYTNPEDGRTYFFPTTGVTYSYGNITISDARGQTNTKGIMGGIAPTTVTHDPFDENNHCLLLDNTSDPIVQLNLAEAYELSKDSGKDLVFEYDFYAEGAATRFNTIAMQPGNTATFRAAAAATDIRFTGSETSGQQFFGINYPYGLTEGWHNYKMVIKGETLTADFYVDDILRVMDVEPASFSGDTLPISGFRFQGAASATAKPAYLDNMKIYLADSAPETDEILITRPYVYANGTYTQIRDFNRYGVNDYQARMNIKIPDASAENPYEFFIITAHYAQDGTLKGITVSEGITVTTNKPTGISGKTYTTSENPASGDYLKVMLWDSNRPLSLILKPSFVLGN